MSSSSVPPSVILKVKWLVKCSNDNASLPYHLYVHFSCFKFHFTFPSLCVANQMLFTWTVNSAAKLLEGTECHRILTHLRTFTYTRESYWEVSLVLLCQSLGYSNPEDADIHCTSLLVCSAGKNACAQVLAQHDACMHRGHKQKPRSHRQGIGWLSLGLDINF